MFRLLLALALAACALFFAPVSFAQGDGEQPFRGHRVVRAVTRTQAQLERLLEITPDVWSEAIGVGPLDVRIPPEQLAALNASGIPYRVLIPDVQALIDRERAGNLQPGGSWFDDFKTYDEVNAYLQTLADLQPDLTTHFIAGQSIEGRDIHGIRITGPGGGDKPILLAQGCQHAREWIAVMVPMFIADALIRNYETDKQIQDLLNRAEIVVVPIVNPDGYVHTWTDYPDNRMWRKNRRNNGDGTFGVDLNRNWAFGWGGEGSSGDTNSNIYRGTAPFSEPESTALSHFILDNPDIRIHLDIHSYGQWLLQPWGWTYDPPPDHDYYEDIGGELSDIIYGVHGRNYVHGPASLLLYLADGIAPDWSYGELGVTGFTFELRGGSGNGFVLPAEEIIPNGEEIVPAILYLAELMSGLLQFDFPLGLPDSMQPDTPTPIQVEILPLNGATLDESSAMLFARFGNEGPFSDSTLTPLGDGLFEGSLPATPCGDFVQYYFQASTTEGDIVTAPANASINVFTAVSISEDFIFADNFETYQGWTVAGDALDGHWERSVPAGGGDRGDPPADGDGSGSCYLTDNEDGNSDVDDGSTILTSPLIDASGTGEVYLSYLRWYSNNSGNAPESDIFEVEISNDGGASWVDLETVGPGGNEVGGGWRAVSFRIADFITPTDAIRVRFIASDLGDGSVVEAGIDALQVSFIGCNDETVLTDFDVTQGSLIEGVLEDLLASDDNAVHARSRFGFTAFEPNLLDLVVGATTSIESPGEIDLLIESHIDHPGGVAKIRYRNWDDDTLQEVEVTTVSETDEIHILTGIPAESFVRSKDGRIEMSVRHVVAATFSATGFNSFFDHIDLDVH